MTKQRNKFLTFLFSLAPGCGQMFMGFMKRGISLLCFFCASIALSSIFNIAEIGLISAVIWCWAFFDSLNLMSLSPDVFQTVKDEFLVLGNDDLPRSGIAAEKLLHYLGYALIFIGALSIWNSVFDYFYNTFYYNAFIAELVYRLNYYLPRLALSALIILIGFRLIRRKKIETREYSTSESNEVNSDEQN